MNKFHAWAFQNFPFMENTFKEIDNYHLMMDILHYLKEQLKDYQELVKQVEDLEQWFNNLDVQEEIDNKLEEMVENGELQEIISQYLNSTAIFGFDTVADLKQATNLINGSNAKTFGYYNTNDGGGATYKIREVTNEDVVDEGFLIALHDENLVAELIIENSEVNMLSIGCKYGDNTFNNTPKLLNAINKANNNKNISKIYFPAGVYDFNTSVDLINNSLNLKSIEIYGASSTEGENNSATMFRYNGTGYFMSINDAFNAKIHDFWLSGTYTNGGIYAENIFWSNFYNLYIRRFVAGIVLDGYNAYNHITNSTFVTNQANNIGVVIGGADTTYPRNYPEYNWIEKNHFELGNIETTGVKIYASFFAYITENDFSNTTGNAISLDANSTIVHNIQDIFIEKNSFAKTKTCVSILGGITGSSVSKIRIDGDYNNPNNQSGYKIVEAVRGDSGGYMGYITITGMVNDYIASEKWVSLNRVANAVIDINDIAIRNIESINSDIKMLTKMQYDTNMIYKNIESGITSSVAGHAITYDFSSAITDTDSGLLIISGTVPGTSSACNFSAVINRGTRWGTSLLHGAGSNISSITATGTTVVITCGDSYTPQNSKSGVKFTFIR